MFMQQTIVEKIEISNDLAQESLISYNGMINSCKEKNQVPIISSSYLLQHFIDTFPIITFDRNLFCFASNFRQRQVLQHLMSQNHNRKSKNLQNRVERASNRG